MTAAIRRRSLTGAMLLLLAGCAQGRDLPLLPALPPGPYRLGAGDQLRVTIFAEQRLSGDFRVADTGNVALPLIGSITVRGSTLEEAQRAIEARFKESRMLANPTIAVEIVEYRPVFVLGMVERGGQTPYQPGMTVLSAMAVMGGFNYRAVTDYVSVTRRDEAGLPREFRAGRSALLQPGDVVNVFERRF